MDLAELKFVVDTKQLELAATRVAELGTAVSKLNKPMQDLSTNTGKVSTATEKASKAAENKAKADTKVVDTSSKLDGLLDKLTNRYTDMAKGSTSAEAGVLQLARSLGATTEEALKPYKAILENIRELSKSPFDSAIGSVRSITQEYDSLTYRAELASKGIFLTTTQLKEYSRIANEIKGKLKAADLDPTKGEGLAKFNSELKVQQDLYLGIATKVNTLKTAEKDRNDLLNAQMKESVRLQEASDNLFKYNLIRHKQDQDGYKQDMLEMRKYYSALEKESKPTAQAAPARMDAAVDAYRKNQAKVADDAAKANAYLAKEMERVNRLNSEAESVTSVTNNRLIRFEQELKKSGATAEQQAAKLAIYRNELLSTQKAAGNRQIDYLSRALGPQITDIAVGLATGQAPLTILLQQGGQLRDQFALAGVAGSQMGDMLVKATSSMITSIKDVGVAIGSAFVGAIANSGKAVTKFAMDITGATNVLENMRYQIALLEKGSSGPIMRTFLALGSALTFLTGTIIVAAIGSLAALAKGFFDAVKEQNALAIQLTLTGASLGLNTASAIDYAKSLNSLGISTGTTIKVIQEMAKQGGFVASEMQMIVVAADNLKLAGVSIEDTVKQFAKFKEKPVEALLEVAKATGMISPEITKLVYQLSEQGKSSDAARIAMKSYTDVTIQQKDRLKDEMSEFSLFMKKLSSSVAKFYDEVFVGLFRKTAPAEAIKRQIADIENRIKLGTQASPKTKAENEATLSALKEQLRLLQQVQDAESTKLSDQARNASLYEQFVKADASFASNEMKRDKELAEAKIRNDQLIAAGTITKAQAERQYQNIRDKYKTPKTEQEKFDENTVKQATDAYLTQIGALDHLTKAEVSLLKLRTDPKWKETPQVIKDQIEALYGAASASEKLVDSEKEAEKALELKNKLLGKSENLGKEYYKTIDLINKYAKEGRFGADEVLQLKAALEATTPEAKRLAAAQAENAKVMAGIAAERAAVSEQYGGDFKTADEKAAIKNLSDYRKKIAQADSEYEKQLSTATEETTYSEWLMYKNQADAKKALAEEVYNREQYLLSDGYKRQQAYATAFEDIFKGMGDAIIDFALTGKTSFGDLTKSILTNLLKMEMQMQMSSIYKGLGGIGGILGSMSGNGLNVSTASTYGTNIGSQQTSMLAAQEAGMFTFAKGGTFTNSIVDSPTMFKFAKGTGLMGEAGPEAIMPLRRGADGSLGVVAGGGSSSNVQVVVNNNSNTTASTKETTDSRGNRRIEVTIGDIVASEVNRKGSGINQTIMSNTGARNQIVRR